MNRHQEYPDSGVGLYPRSSPDLGNSLSIVSYVTQGLCIVLCNICVALRFYARQNVWKSFNPEDCEYGL
jgi:hypothetical protein